LTVTNIFGRRGKNQGSEKWGLGRFFDENCRFQGKARRAGVSGNRKWSSPEKFPSLTLKVKGERRVRPTGNTALKSSGQGVQRPNPVASKLAGGVQKDKSRKWKAGAECFPYGLSPEGKKRPSKQKTNLLNGLM